MKILVFDTETAGLPKNYKAHASAGNNWPNIIQLAFLVAEDGHIIHRYQTLIKPRGWVIGAEAQIVHGISQEQCEMEGIEIEDALAELLKWQAGADLLVAHNTGFDVPVIASEMMRCNIKAVPKPKFCTMNATTDICRIPGPYGFKWPKLQELHQFLFNEGFDGAHNALADVEATNKCFWELINRGLIEV